MTSTQTDFVSASDSSESSLMIIDEVNDELENYSPVQVVKIEKKGRRKLPLKIMVEESISYSDDG